MPRKRARSPTAAAPAQDKSELDDDDLFFDDTQSLSGRSGGSHEPQHRNAANARERARMRVLSKAFCRLKTTLPWVPADTKLSKLDTLRLAASYIAHLRALLHEEPRTAAQMFPHPLNLAWPFAFQHGAAGQCAASPRSGWSSAQSHSPSPPTRDNPPKDADVARDNVDMTTDSAGISRDGVSRNCHSYAEFASNDYGEMAGNETNCAQSVQFCNNGFSYRENYYEMRNAYSDSLLNNIQ